MPTNQSHKNNFEVTIIFCTFNRTQDLVRAIDSVIAQSLKASSIIIIDNSSNDHTEETSPTIKNKVVETGIKYLYLRNREENSLTLARNMGVKHADTDFVLFLDDDIELNSDYLHELASLMNSHPDAVAFQGYIPREKPNFFKNFLYKLIGEFHLEKNSCKSLYSISTSYPYPEPKIPISCDFLSGANHAVRREVFEKVTYDTKLTKYSDGEDLDFGLRVARAYPGKVWLVPTAKLQHHTAPGGRLPSQELILMQEVYGLYLNYKLYPNSIKARIYYIINRIFRILLRGYSSMKNQNWGYLINTIKAYLYCINNRTEISKGQLNLYKQN